MRKYYKNNSGTIFSIWEDNETKKLDWGKEITEAEYNNIQQQYEIESLNKIKKKKIKCKCCGYRTIKEEWDICPICFWEKDPVMEEDGFEFGANQQHIFFARINYQTFGASENRVLQYCRKPNLLERLDKFLKL